MGTGVAALLDETPGLGANPQPDAHRDSRPTDRRTQEFDRRLRDFTLRLSQDEVLPWDAWNAGIARAWESKYKAELSASRIDFRPNTDCLIRYSVTSDGRITDLQATSTDSRLRRIAVKTVSSLQHDPILQFPEGTKVAIAPKQAILRASGTSGSSNTDDQENPQPAGTSRSWQPWEFRVNREYSEQILRKVDEIVSDNLYSQDLSKNVWPKALEAHRKEILESKTLLDLFRSLNSAIGKLNSSHCEFATSNDEIFYFLHDLFGRWNHKMRLEPNDFVGFVTGPPRYAFNQVRYVLDDSPAAKAGIQIGDVIVSIDGQPYVGQMNLLNKAKKTVAVSIDRAGKPLTIDVPVIKSDQYKAYIEAMKKSVTTFNVDNYKLGYVHDWCGGSDSHDELDEAVSKLHDSDGLILDLRDGYGGNSSQDLDVFFRPEPGFPPFIVKQRDGKTRTEFESYDKPLVAIINDGARSGKELMANTLKLSNRAKLVGIPTAGAVLAGKLFPIDKRCALYLAVNDVTVGTVRLEGHGVQPDFEIGDRLCEEGHHEQLEKAKSVLVDLIKQHR